MYGFTCYVWNLDKILIVAEMLKNVNPSTTIVLGGPEASGLAEKILKKHDFVDFVFKGEGEEHFRSFLLDKKLSEIPGLVYRNNGKISSNPELELKNLDELILPFESQDYRDYLEQSEIPVRAAIETSRGCPFSCAYFNW